MMNFNPNELLDGGESSTANSKTVDSLLMHNYSPPSFQHHHHQTTPLLHIPQQQQHQMFPQQSVTTTTNSYPHHQYQFVVKQQYRKVRPEAVNERSLVGSVVGYLHERVVASVVGEKANIESSRPGNGGASMLSGSNPNGIPSMHEIKEQIEWLHFENIGQLDVARGGGSGMSNHNLSGGSARSTTPLFNDANVLLLIGYKTGFSVWIIDTNGVASECLLVKEPNITHVKVIQIEGSGRILLAICKLVLNDSPPASVKLAAAAQQQSHSSSNYHLDSTYNENSNDSGGDSEDSNGSDVNLSSPLSSSDSVSSPSSTVSSPNTTAPPPMSPLPGPPPVPIVNSATSSTQFPKRYAISIVNVSTGECLRQINFTGHIIELKSNGHMLCVNSWMRVDAYDLTTFEHRFTLSTCFSQLSKSSGKLINPIALGSRWLAFADTKYHSMLGSIGGVCTGLEPSYTATVLNTAKSISKGLVTVVQSVMTGGGSSTSGNDTSNGNGMQDDMMKRKRHDSKDEHHLQLHYQPGVCTIIDTKKYFNTHFKQNQLHDEAQNWIVAHFVAHQQEALYALEFNQNGRLLVTCDSLGQYFNVFQINPNPFKCTRSSVKHLYSLYRGDTVAKVRQIAFSADNRWLAVNSKRGTTHIFPINPHGGPINVRTHARPFVANRTSKHQRTAGFSDQDGDLFLNLTTTTSAMSGNMSGGGGGGMDDVGSSHSSSSPIVLQNNPKLRSLLEPFVIPAYAQLKQPNVNSQFQSSVLSTNAVSSSLSSSNSGGNPMGLLATVSALQPHMYMQQHQQQQLSNTSESYNNGSLLSGSNLAASAYNSAALVTENVTQFASNTSNLIQYDNVSTMAVFADSRGYLSPEEPRDLNRMRPAQSLFVISDVNGNLVEYVLDVVIDANKSASGKLSQDCPIQLKITPKAQWPLQRFISSAEVKIPIYTDNPILQGFLTSSSSSSSANTAAVAPRKPSLNSYDSYSPNSLFVTAPNSIDHTSGNNINNNGVPSDWMKSIEVNTHIGPHRRLFMGPQFVFKTFNSSIQTKMLNAGSSAVIGDSETPIIDLSDDIELNTLDITNGSKQRQKYSMPMQINNNILASKSYTSMNRQQQQPYGCTPTFIEVGPGSYQEGMPILCGALAANHHRHQNGSQKSLNNNNGGDLLGDNLIESLADAMNELNTSDGASYLSSHHQKHSTRSKHNSSSSGHSSAKTMSPAIAIHHNLSNRSQPITTNATTSGNNKTVQNNNSNNMLLINTMPVEQASSLGSNSSSNGILTVGSYFLVNGMSSAGLNSSNPSSSVSSGPPSSASSTGSSSGSSSNGGGGGGNSNAPNNSNETSNIINRSSSNELDLIDQHDSSRAGVFKSGESSSLFSRNLLQFHDDNLLN